MVPIILFYIVTTSRPLGSSFFLWRYQRQHHTTLMTILVCSAPILKHSSRDPHNNELIQPVSEYTSFSTISYSLQTPRLSTSSFSIPHAVLAFLTSMLFRNTDANSPRAAANRGQHECDSYPTSVRAGHPAHLRVARSEKPSSSSLRTPARHLVYRLREHCSHGLFNDCCLSIWCILEEKVWQLGG